MATVFKRGGKRAKGKWYASWYDHNGKRRTRCTRTTDKATAERIAKKYEADAALRREGVIDPTLDAISKESQRSIESHLADYEAKFNAANRDDQYVRSTLNYIRRICTEEKFTVSADIAADGVNRYAGRLKENGCSSRTIQAYLVAIKGFTKWLTINNKLPRDPLASVKKPNPKSDRKRERRMLLPDEWKWLKSVTAASPERYAATGAERVLLYETAIQTGLRADELRSLTRGSLHLDDDRPYIVCKASTTKNNRLARQYVRPETAAALGNHVSRKTPTATVFSLPSKFKMADMFRDDLADARRAWLDSSKHDPAERVRREQSDFLSDRNHGGEITDFHCLRHTCGAWLAMTGAHPKVVQQVMRHQSITLTMDTYGHLFPGQEANAVDGLQDLLAGPPEALAATGTDDAPVNAPTKAQRQAQHTQRETGRVAATGCDVADKSAENSASGNPLQIAKIDDKLLNVATPCGATAPLAQLSEQLNTNH